MWNLIPWKKNQAGNGGGTMTAEPFEREFSRIRDDFDHLLQRVWSGSPLLNDRLFDHLGLDLDETETHFVARIDAPGFEVEDFNVHVSGNNLVVKAERKESQNGKKGSSYRYGSFYRTLSLPQGSETEQIDARYHNGVLELMIPKGKEAQNVKRIAVKAA